MDSDKLYRVQRKDLPKLEKILNLCFAHDPLYETLIPDPEVRKRLMPELFHCDLDEFFETCEIFADSEELKGLPTRIAFTASWHGGIHEVAQHLLAFRSVQHFRC